MSECRSRNVGEERFAVGDVRVKRYALGHVPAAGIVTTHAHHVRHRSMAVHQLAVGVLFPVPVGGKFGEALEPGFAVAQLRLGQAKVIGMYTRMTPEGYVAQITPAWEDFPTADAVADTARMNRELEKWINTMPEQYYWVHKRFKTRQTELAFAPCSSSDREQAEDTM